jgi:hypothetical protein
MIEPSISADGGPKIETIFEDTKSKTENVYENLLVNGKSG